MKNRIEHRPRGGGKTRIMIQYAMEEARKGNIVALVRHDGMQIIRPIRPQENQVPALKKPPGPDPPHQ